MPPISPPCIWAKLTGGCPQSNKWGEVCLVYILALAQSEPQKWGTEEWRNYSNPVHPSPNSPQVAPQGKIAAAEESGAMKGKMGEGLRKLIEGGGTHSIHPFWGSKLDNGQRREGGEGGGAENRAN
jgi:hypothetical protein